MRYLFKIISWPWKCCPDWSTPKKWLECWHIIAMEIPKSYQCLSYSLVTVLIILTKAGGNLRFIALLDSRVVKGAQVKGRSSSTALRGTLQKSCALQLAGNPYPSFGLAPTRLKKTDAPTRFKDLPDTAEFSILDVLYFEQIRSLHAMQFSKPTANWIRFFILILSCFNVFKHPLSDLMDFSDASSSHHIFGFWIPPFGFYPFVHFLWTLPCSLQWLT